MKREFRDESFEEFLKRSADNLRMKAPERVWENLSKKLSKDRQRFGTGLSVFFLLAGLLGYLSISTTTKQTFLTKGPAAHASRQQIAPSGKRGETTVSQGAVTGISKSWFEKENTQRKTLPAGIDTYPAAQPFLPEQVPPAEKGEPQGQNLFVPTTIDEYPDIADHVPAGKEQAAKPVFLPEHNAAPWSIESVTNAFIRKRSRFQTQFYFAPTVSYRKLSENKSYLRNVSFLNSPPSYAALYGSVNNMVTHKPDIGFELGVTEKYSLSQKLRIRGGLQFNVNRYDIKAFRAPYAIATIALNSRRSSRVDSVLTISNYSNVDGSSDKSNWLQNLSFQVSAPMGAELALKGSDKMQFGIAATVQPTYILGDRAYLITNDYKSYTQIPWLLRRWNVNTALETFVSYNTGKTRWQVGPQVRYQLLSSFISNYPVKENLFDFGLKIGLSVNK